MRTLSAVVIAGVAFSLGWPQLAHAQAGRGAARPAQSTPMDLAEGKKVFDSQCAWCHGNDGDGGMGPNLHGKLRHATSYESIVDIITKGIPGTDMPSFSSPLTERASRQAAAYVQSLSRASMRPVAGNAQHGAELYSSTGCAGCHVINGQGGIVGPDLTDIAARRGPAYLRESIVKPAASHPPGYLVVHAVLKSGLEVRGTRVNEDVFFVHIRDTSGTVHTLEKADLARLDREADASLMPSYESRVSGADLDDLVAYLSTLRGTGK
ncbi:MAG TPA: c-type cytochrome [Vicinamibacterales bacterium]|nr:c-type cytochrome [Vicinamibacterales bacterium]